MRAAVRPARRWLAAARGWRQDLPGQQGFEQRDPGPTREVVITRPGLRERRGVLGFPQAADLDRGGVAEVRQGLHGDGDLRPGQAVVPVPALLDHRD